MMDDTHIADGIAVKLLLAGLVVASASIGTLALAGATSSAATGSVSDDAAAPTPRLLFPIDNVTVTGLDRVAPLAFPIDNVTVGDSYPVLTSATGADRYALGQDMDPYALGRDVNAYRLLPNVAPDAPGQDMDPY